MSNHFTYEIDERNIRMQLKGHKLDVNDEHWQRFQDNFTETQHFSKKSVKANTFNITLNRNVVLPLVFGVFILGFSLLLVNFMSIKNVTKSSTVTPAEVLKDSPQTTNSSPTVVKTNSKPAVQKTVQTEQAPLSDAEHAVTVKELQKIAGPDLNYPVESEPTLTAASAPIQTEVANETTATITESGTIPANEQTKKKRKKRVLESLETEESSALRPTLVSEDREAEVRPE